MEIIESLINQLNKLPGIGRKTATRLAFHIVTKPEKELKELTKAIEDIPKQIVQCSICNNFTSKDKDPCSICSNPKRDKNRIIVVTSVQDLMAIEDIKNYRGSYHVLHGLISPLNGIGPDDIKIDSLIKRLTSDHAEKELILGTTPNVDGETTAIYIKKLLENYSFVKITQVANGIPIGSELEYVDKITLTRAIENRS